MTVKFQPQTFKVARFHAPGKVEAKDVEDADVNPSRPRFGSVGLDLGNRQKRVDVEVDMDADREDGKCTSSTGIPESEPGPKPESIPILDLPSLSEQLPSPHGSSKKPPDFESSSDKICEPPQAPEVR